MWRRRRAPRRRGSGAVAAPRAGALRGHRRWSPDPGIRPARARRPLVVGAVVVDRPFLGDLDGDLLDRQRQRRLRLGGADAHRLAAVALGPPFTHTLGR